MKTVCEQNCASVFVTVVVCVLHEKEGDRMLKTDMGTEGEEEEKVSYRER